MIVAFLFIALIIAIVMMIGLLVQNVLISKKCNKYKQENNRLNELLAIPVPVMREVITKFSIRTFCVKRIIPVEEANLYGEKYREFTKKQMTRELAESLVSNGFVEFIDEKEPGMGETITARIEVIQR